LHFVLLNSLVVLGGWPSGAALSQQKGSMKAAAVICQMRNGEFQSIPGGSLVPVLDAARKIRDSGVLNGEAVVGGVVICSWQPTPAMKFRCSQPIEVEAKKSKKAK